MSGGRKNGDVIRDSIDGRSLEFSGAASELIKTPEFQRLGNVMNLGLTHVVFPSAHNMRYSHCMGTAYMAKRFASRLGLDPHRQELVEIAGLLHDIGHGPFSHVIDDSTGLSHQEITRKIILGEMEMPDRRYSKTKTIPEILESYGISKEVVVGVLDGTHPFRALCTLISGSPFDCDKADYLQRDAHSTGIQSGKIDVERIGDVLVIENVEGHPQLGILEKGFDPMYAFRYARVNMYRNAYRHPRVIVFEDMLLHAVQMAGMGYQERWHLDDGECLAKVAEANEKAAEIVSMVKLRISYKRVFTLASNCPENREFAKHAKQTGNLEEMVASHAGLARESVLVGYRLSEPKEKPFFPMRLRNGEVMNFYDYDRIDMGREETEAWVLEKVPLCKVCMYVAVHPSSDTAKQEKVASFMEAMKSDFLKKA